MKRKLNILVVIVFILCIGCKQNNIYNKIDELSLMNDLEELNKYMESPNDKIKLYAIEAMGKTYNSNAVSFLIPYLYYSNLEVNAYASASIANLGYNGFLNESEKNILISLLEDNDYHSKPAIAACLGFIASPKFVKPLLYTTTNQNYQLSHNSIIGLEEIIKEHAISVKCKSNALIWVTKMTNSIEKNNIDNIYQHIMLNLETNANTR